MDSSLLDGFQVVESPISSNRLNLEEFSSASTPLQSAYCRQMSTAEFDAIGESETERELKLLVEHLEKNPSDFIRLMRKRKIEEMENGGMFSFIKCKLMTKLKGDNYVDSLVSNDDCQQQLKQLTEGMLVVHSYTKETRRSSRLAEKQCNTLPSTPVLTRRAIHSTTPPTFKPPALPAYLPPPPPPPPLPDSITLPVVAPLKDRNNVLAKSLKQCSAKLKKISSSKLRSSAPVQSIREELMSADPVKRLRSTQVPRSPGGTPVYNTVKCESSIGSWTGPLDSPEPMHAALIRIFEHKFRNIRSPSPSTSVINSPTSQPFSP